jgi:hypothetical protein
MSFQNLYNQQVSELCSSMVHDKNMLTVLACQAQTMPSTMFVLDDEKERLQFCECHE